MNNKNRNLRDRYDNSKIVGMIEIGISRRKG